MHNKLRILRGATALLYLGPLLAGLGGFGWRIVPVFVAIFLLWTLILRPSSWPQTRADWTRPEALVTLLAQSAVQILLITLCFGIGRGLGGVLGARPPVPVLLPISISFLAIPLCRLIWDPSEAEATDCLMDAATNGIGTALAGTSPDCPDVRAVTARLLAPLQALPDTVPDAEIARHLQAIGTHADAGAIAHVLLSTARSGSGSPAGLRALILHVTDPRTAELLAGHEYPSRAFQLISGDPALTLLYAQRSLAQLQGNPDASWDCASPQDLRRTAARSARNVAAALTELAEATERLAPRDPGLADPVPPEPMPDHAAP